MKDSSVLFLQLKERVPSDAYMALKQSLENADDAKFEAIMFINFKSPILGLLLSSIVPGIDRIYKGDVALGIFKFVYVILAYLFFNLYYELTGFEDERLFFALSLALLLAVIWVISDIFLIYKAIKKDNLKKIFEILKSDYAD